MGGGDLNMKKSWHPLTYANRERIWLEEQKVEEEQRRLEQWKKEVEEERQIQELQRLKEEAGHVPKRPERVDWMYASGPSQVASFRSAEQEAYLLGKRRVDDIVKNAGHNDEKDLSSGSGYTGFITGNANTLRDTQAKIREDPLLLIKKREQELMESVLNNPLKVREMEKKRDRSDARSSHHSERHGSSKSSRYHGDDRRDEYSRRERSRSPKRPHFHHDRRRSPSPERAHRHSTRNGHYEHQHASYRKQDAHGRDHRQSAEEERQRKLREMMSNAEDMEKERKERLARIAEEEARRAELEEAKRRRNYSQDIKSSFIKHAEYDAYSGSTMDLSERLRRQRAHLAKVGDD